VKRCLACELVFSDVRLNASTIQSHFERAYKDDTYFLHARRFIFAQIAEWADRLAPRGGTILDIGGAKGHLLAEIRKCRPDLTLALNDISRDACDSAAVQHGFQTFCGNVAALEEVPGRFDVLILSDVIYYEPELNRLWKCLEKLVRDDGGLVIRVPNKLPLITFWEGLRRLLVTPSRRAMQNRVAFLNPEHLYVFSRRHLKQRLTGLGFKDFTVVPSALLANNGMGFLARLYVLFARAVFTFSLGRLVITPSMLVIARRHGKRQTAFLG